ncbi:MAG TPA: DUF3626 domain-containing protein [Streptosporangiaceae bacterium]
MRQLHEEALEHVAAVADGDPGDQSWRVTLHFHPDRLVGGVPILERMALDRVYRSQFETRVSNGGLTAYPDGDRWRWESRIFGAVYDDSPPAGRPKYGSLNFRQRRIGGSPRFRSAHLRLTADALARATFCHPDSAAAPEHFGIAARLSSLVKLAEADDRDALDDYIEAHVHGPIHISADVDALVLDPCYRATSVEDGASRLGCPVEWHGGFAVTAAAFLANPGYRGPGYRGPEFARLGASLAGDRALTPRLIGDASRAGRHDEQALKRVWHYVARFGSPELPGRRT